MAVIHISEAEAARDFARVMAKVRAGEEVRVGDDVAIFFAPPAQRRKTLSEAIRRAKERGLDVILDDQFGRDLERVICDHEREVGTRDPWAE